MPFFKSLAEAETLLPRKLPGWQQWMHRNHDQVNDEYRRRYPDRDDRTRGRDIGERCKIARAFWNELSEEDQAIYIAEAEQQYDLEFGEYNILQQTLTAVLPPTMESQLQ